jgi:hypothetical protein
LYLMERHGSETAFSTSYRVLTAATSTGWRALTGREVIGPRTILHFVCMPRGGTSIPPHDFRHCMWLVRRIFLGLPPVGSLLVCQAFAPPVCVLSFISSIPRPLLCTCFLIHISMNAIFLHYHGRSAHCFLPLLNISIPSSNPQDRHLLCYACCPLHLATTPSALGLYCDDREWSLSPPCIYGRRWRRGGGRRFHAAGGAACFHSSWLSARFALWCPFHYSRTR